MQVLRQDLDCKMLLIERRGVYLWLQAYTVLWSPGENTKLKKEYPNQNEIAV